MNNGPEFTNRPDAGAEKIPSTEDAGREIAANFIAEKYGVAVNRPITPLTPIEPADIFADYANYDGHFHISQEHIGKMLPGYERPNEELIAERAVIQKEVYGSMPATESATAIQMVKAIQPRTILEIGTHRGYLMKALMHAAPEDCIGFCVDLPPSKWDTACFPHDAVQQHYTKNLNDDQIGEEVKNDPLIADRVHIFEQDSGSFNFSPYYGLIDVVVVDGNHTVDSVKHDLEEAFKLVRPGGVVLVDDFQKGRRLAGVTFSVHREVFENGRNFYFVNHFQDNDLPPSHLGFFIG